MTKQHRYRALVEWTGNRGRGTSAYLDYDRNWEIRTPGKPPVQCSNDPLLGGDPALHNPEDLLLASLAACHMLWYLHLCANAGITVVFYRDSPIGLGETEPGGAGRFLSVTLNPEVTISRESDAERARSIHREIHKYCFIARSVNFPVHYEPQISVEQ
jgi:organic hydroperoxide reductase OsmC/OhrA